MQGRESSNSWGQATIGAAVLLAVLVLRAPAQEPPGPPGGKPAAQGVASSEEKKVPIDLELPKPAFKGTPKHVPPGSRLEKPREAPRPPFLAPEGSKKISVGKPVTASDRDPIVGGIRFVTDGNKEAHEGSYVELGPGLQWVQIDLQARCRIDAVVVWHYHMNARVYHDVILQVSDDPDFITGVTTIFNNDHDNSSGLGLGDDLEYWETYEGKLVDAKGVEGRYLRALSNGSTSDDMNHLTEIEVWGREAL